MYTHQRKSDNEDTPTSDIHFRSHDIGHTGQLLANPIFILIKQCFIAA